MKKISIYFIGTLSTKMLSVLLVPIYAYFVLVEDLGEYDYIAAIASIFVPIAFAAIWESVLKYCIKCEEDTEAIFSTVVVFSISMSLICIVIYPIISFFIGTNLTLLFVLIFVMTQGLTTIWQFSARALHENKRYVVAGVIGSATIIVIDSLLILLYRLDYIGLSISYIISQVSIIVVLELKIHLLSKLKFNLVSKSILKKLLLFSIPLVINNVSLWLYSSGSKILIKNYIGATENGLYSFASKFSILISLFSTVISMAVIEEAYSYKTIDEYRTKISSIIAKISKAYFSLIVLALPAIYILYNIAFKNTEYFESANYVFLLLLAALFTALSNNFGSSFQVTNNTKYIPLTTILGVVATLGTSLILIKTFGIYGVLIGGVVGPFVMMFTRAIYAKKATGLQFKWLGNIIACIVGICENILLTMYKNLVIQLAILLAVSIFILFEYRKELKNYVIKYLER